MKIPKIFLPTAQDTAKTSATGNKDNTNKKASIRGKRTIDEIGEVFSTPTKRIRREQPHAPKKPNYKNMNETQKELWKLRGEKKIESIQNLENINPHFKKTIKKLEFKNNNNQKHINHKFLLSRSSEKKKFSN